MSIAAGDGARDEGLATGVALEGGVDGVGLQGRVAAGCLRVAQGGEARWRGVGASAGWLERGGDQVGLEPGLLSVRDNAVAEDEFPQEPLAGEAVYRRERGVEFTSALPRSGALPHQNT